MPDAGAARALRADEDEELRTERSLRLVEENAADPSLDWLREPGARRTVRITGQPLRAERRRIAAPASTGSTVYPARRRRTVTEQRIRTRPDRIALWAFLLGLFLVFMAVATANAAPL
jgi:hypothetical protein